MVAIAKCTNCQTSFPVKSNLKYKVRFNLSFALLALRNIAMPWLDGFEDIYKPNIVLCPNCGKEFSAKGYKYFGFIEAKHFQVGLVILILLMFIAFFATAIWSVVK
jgi:hypothetical protein